MDPRALLVEMEELRGRGVDVSRLYVSDRAHVVMPYHILLDRLEEDSRGAEKIGATLRGIGPAYCGQILAHRNPHGGFTGRRFAAR